MGNIIVVMALKSCSNCDKSPNLVTLNLAYLGKAKFKHSLPKKYGVDGGALGANTLQTVKGTFTLATFDATAFGRWFRFA